MPLTAEVRQGLIVVGTLVSLAGVGVALRSSGAPGPSGGSRGPVAPPPTLEELFAHADRSRDRFERVATVKGMTRDRETLMLSADGTAVALQLSEPAPSTIGPGDILEVKGRVSGASRFGVPYVRGTYTLVRQVFKAPPPAPSASSRTGGVEWLTLPSAGIATGASVR